MVLADFATGDWIAIAGIVLGLLGGFVAWMTKIALNTGKTVQMLEHMQGTQQAHGKSIDSHDDRIQVLDLRVTKLEAVQ